MDYEHPQSVPRYHSFRPRATADARSLGFSRKVSSTYRPAPGVPLVHVATLERKRFPRATTLQLLFPWST
uniref:Uncharacterized protein n=1 Tax=Anopheles christyi TaxID=43041 RepID=A0A182KHP7_9DIPT